MKICVVGAGAVGSHLAVSLTHAGAEVTLLARGATLEAVRDKGLELRTDEGTFNVRLTATDDPHSLGPHDAVLVTVKSPALSAVAPAIAPLLERGGVAVFLQNGIPWWYHHGVGGETEGRRLAAIDPGDLLWNSVGPQRVLGGITSSACNLLAPGVVQVRGGNRLVMLGEPDGSLSQRLLELESLFRSAGFPVQATPRIRDAIWSKLALNLGSGPLTVLAPVPLKELYAQPACVDARLRIMDEVAAIARAMGCAIEVDYGLTFAQASPHIPSIAQDVLAGRKPEIETMFRAPLAMARERGVATPTLDLLVALATLKAAAAGLYP